MPTPTIADLHAAARAETDPERKAELNLLLAARTAAGNGTTEERLLRLMAWLAGRLHAGPAHTRLRDPIAILRSGEAWCDQAGKVFLWLAWRLLDLDGREVAIYHVDGVNGHTVSEVWYDGAWHLFDTHAEHQAVYRGSRGTILDRAALVAARHIVAAEEHWWRGADGTGKEGFYAPESGHREYDYDAPKEHGA